MSTGALSLVETALYASVEVCFANPGGKPRRSSGGTRTSGTGGVADHSC